MNQETIYNVYMMPGMAANPKIFDFIKRAKRDTNDDYYSDEDVYSITGYILKINNLFDGKILDKKKLSGIIMPNRDGFINFSN